MTNLKVRLPDTYLRGDFTARFALQLAHKDVSLATALGREVNVPMRLATLCEQDLTHAMGRGWARHDASVVLTLQEERAAGAGAAVAACTHTGTASDSGLNQSKRAGDDVERAHWGGGLRQ